MDNDGHGKPTLEESLSRCTDLFAANRATSWEMGDHAAAMVQQHGRDIIRHIAAACNCTRERIGQLVKVAMAYPPEHRYPDVPWGRYRVCIAAAKRLDKPPAEVLEMALAGELTDEQVRELGREARAILNCRCEHCGSGVSVKTSAGLADRAIACPVCAIGRRWVELGRLRKAGG